MQTFVLSWVHLGMPARSRPARTAGERRQRGRRTRMLVFLLSLFLVGLIAGALARLIVPGHDPIGILGTALLGIVGSFVGGLLASLLFEHSLQLRTTRF